VQRLGYREPLDRSDEAIGAVRPLDLAAVEQHPHRLDGVERDTLCAFADRRPQLVGEARNQALEECAHRLGRKGLESQA